MQQRAAERTMAQAARILKRMNVQGPEWGDLATASREAVRDGGGDGRPG